MKRQNDEIDNQKFTESENQRLMTQNILKNDGRKICLTVHYPRPCKG